MDVRADRRLTHDHAVWEHYRIDYYLSTDQVVADKGHQDSGAFSPDEKPIRGRLAGSDHQRKTSIHKIRWAIEVAASHQNLGDCRHRLLLAGEHLRPSIPYHPSIHVLHAGC